MPRGAHEPIGRDRARRDAAPPRTRRDAPDTPPPRPDLPTDEEPSLARGVLRDIERTLGRGSRSRDVALALSIGGAAIEEDRPDVAVPTLAWARHEAPRLAVLREAYGVALYLDGSYAAALSELQTYRRLTGQRDQNHLIADCLRALDRPLEQIASVASELVDDDEAPEDRRAEAVIVWASANADAGALPAARALLRRYLTRRPGASEEHDLRIRQVAADLALRAEDLLEAREHLRSIAAVDPSFLEVTEQLEAVERRIADAG